MNCSALVNDRFGPAVGDDCPGRFDFTLLFEELILSTVPLGIACSWAAIRLHRLWDEAAKVDKSAVLLFKLALYVLITSLQVVLLVLWQTGRVDRSRFTLPCLILALPGHVLLSVLSCLEHVRSVRPSTLLCLYLGVTCLLDMARVRTAFLFLNSPAVSWVLLFCLVVTLSLLLLEVTEKRHLLKPAWKSAGPEEVAGIVNRAFFIWLNGIFIKGFRTLLTVDMLSPLDSEMLEASSPTKLVSSWKRANQEKEHSLFLTFLWHYRWALLSGTLPRLAYTGFSYSQPFLVERVLDFVSEDREPDSNKIAYGLIGAYAIVYVGLSLAFAVYQHKTYRLLTLYRGSLTAMIFSKTLKMSASSTSEAEAITLMSADIDRIGSSMSLIHELYASVIELALALWLLYRLLGMAILAPIVWVILCLVAAMPLARAAANAQIPWLEAIETRLTGTAKALGNMKAIKMTGLTDIICSRIAGLRNDEIRASLRHRVLNILVFISYFASTALAPVWAFTAFILIAKARGSETLTEGVAFAVLSIFELLNQPIIYMVDGVEHIQTVINSFRRIQNYLTSPERQDQRHLPAPAMSSESSVSGKDGIHGKGLQDEKVFSPQAQCPGVMLSLDEVSAGYNLEEKMILKDLSFKVGHGQVTIIAGPVGCGKSTLLRAILGEVPFRGSIAAGFRTAAYCPQTPWSTWGTVRNNIVGVSPWDRAWYDTVVDACALNADFRELSNGDQTMTGTRGSQLSGGQQMRVSFARALYSRNPVMVLDDVLTGLDRTTERHIIDRVFSKDGMLKQLRATVIMASNSAHHLSLGDQVIVLDEGGKMVSQGAAKAVSLPTSPIQPEGVAQSQPAPKETDDDEAEIWQEIDMLIHPSTEENRHAGDMRIYGYYAKIAGRWTIGVYLFACCIFVFGMTFPSVWMQWWTNANAENPNERTGYWLGVYGALAALTILGCALADCTFNLVVLPKTSRKFHQLLLDTTMRAHISFLTSTDAGTTLNRFSQDLELIDNDLPQAMDQTIFQFLSAIVSAVLVFIGSSYIGAAIPLCIAALVFVQFYYLRTSRQLRLLDIETKAPLFSQFLETVNGVSCIRAYGWSDAYMERSCLALNVSQKPYYLLWCIQRWLTLVLDLFNAGLALLLVGIATNIRGSATSFLGVALFNIVTFSSTLQTLVTEWTQVETALGAINRIRSFVLNVKDENLPGEKGEVPQSWPATGHVVFDNVSASYKSAAEPVLNQVSFQVESGEKVAICGRTGSGKSSLIATLLRLLEVDGGKICVDGIDVSTIPRQEVRRRLNTVPQDSFLLAGKLREDLDPFRSATDEELVDVLGAVGLWDIFEPVGGLESDIGEDMLSHGQRQLYCLARAVVRQSPILVLDEATSNVDADTDKAMQELLRSRFKDQTVISVVHKLQSVLDFDRVILLENGRLVESGKPRELLSTPASAFLALYQSLEPGHGA
ncbi:ABC transporter [Metarhizium album ARSEF 1941]|uniref:ABC transporter n=1 Tax=Metarhizium album (strain ARSEF 1941) TaxID=1081103 RepID=A0A0B2WRK6_METAS|nr:ABC transporter [Metarhizium album ARSEF 1941]KHN96132.1 ABC transporter [Metarhizium album ARSEF 1941]